MGEETFTLTGRELGRLRVLESSLAGRITNAEGARAVGLSVRQFIRLKGRAAKEGPQGVIHAGRGEVSARRLPEEKREAIKDLLAGTYAGFNDTHAQEMLAEREGLVVSRETLRRLRMEAGLGPARRRRAPKHRRRRDRCAREGTMLLLDGSEHDWLEGRGPVLNLIGAIDDATGKVIAARFEESEDLAGYLDLFARILGTKGIPASIYTDRHSVFCVTKAASTLEDQLAGEPELTQFGRTMAELGVVQIFSLSPQARGRIERLWGSLQDRLSSELRLGAVATKEEANAFLGGFLPRYNRRFSVPAAEERADWLPAPRDLDWFLCAKYVRTVANDNTVRLGDLVVDIGPGPDRLSYAKAKVEVHELRTGEVRVIYKGRVIARKAPPADFYRLRCRHKRLTAPGQLPVALLPARSCETCSEKTAVKAGGQ